MDNKANPFRVRSVFLQAKGFHDHSRPAAKSTGMSLKRKLHAKRERQQQLLFKQERQQQQHQLLPRQDEQKEYLAYAPPPPDQQRGGAEHCPGSGGGQPMLHSPVAAEGEVPPVQLSSSSEWEQQALAFKDYGEKIIIDLPVYTTAICRPLQWMLSGDD